MTLKLFLWLLAAIAVGAMLVLLGLRGRRINRNPCCKQCGFDLAAHYPQSPTCPECGAGIKLARFVQMGQRRRMWSLVVLGLPLIVLPMAPIAVVLFASITRTDLSRYKPLPLLLWEARNLPEPDVKASGAFLYDKQLKGQLTPEEYDRVLAAAFAMQANADRPFPDEWGEIVDQARLDGKVNDEQVAAVRMAGAAAKWQCRPMVHAGMNLPIFCEAKGNRLPPMMEAMVTYTLKSAEIDGQKASLRALSSGTGQSIFSASSRRQQSAVFYLAGSKSQYARWWQQGVGGNFAIKVPSDMPAGPHIAKLTVEVEAGEMPDYSRGGKAKEKKATKKTLELELPFTVIEAEKALVETIPATGDVSKELADRLMPMNAQNYGSRATPMLTMSFNVQSIQTPFAYKVFLVSNESEHAIGVLTNAKSGFQSDGGYNMYQNGGQLTLNANLPAGTTLKGSKLVLKPDAEIAAGTVDLTKIYGGEITIDKLTVDERYADNTPVQSGTSIFLKLLGF